MNKTKFFSITLLIALISLIMIGCSPATEEPTIADTTETLTEDQGSVAPKIVASTSWTAVIAEAAGAQDVIVLAPVELRHPPEYDFKPSDIQALQEADWIIMAGYEPFMNKMLESSDISEDKVIRVNTTNTYENLTEQTALVAERIGTEEVQQQWVASFADTLDMINEKAQANGVEEIKVLVHTHMQAFVRSLGFDVLEVYNADELSPAKMAELAALKPDLIIDNYHNPQGMAIAELAGVDRVELRNFPGSEHANLIELFIDNVTKLGLYE